MLAKNDSSISEFTSTLYEMSEDDRIWEQCLAREMHERDLASAVAHGRTQLSELYKKLLENNRSEDFLHACSDNIYLEQLLREFNL